MLLTAVCFCLLCGHFFLCFVRKLLRSMVTCNIFSLCSKWKWLIRYWQCVLVIVSFVGNVPVAKVKNQETVKLAEDRLSDWVLFAIADPASSMAEVVITGVKRLSQVESAAQQSTHSHQRGFQPEETRSLNRSVSSLSVAQMPSFSQLESIIPPPPVPETSSIRIKEESADGSGVPAGQYLSSECGSSSSTHTNQYQQSPVHRATPSPSSGGFPPFSQPQFPPRPGPRPIAVAGPSHRLSPVDPAVHSSTPQFPYPYRQYHSPGRALGERKDYNCQECGKTFRSQQSLSYHRNAKHGYREDLKCSLCGKMLGHKQHKNYHMKHVHGIDASLGWESSGKWLLFLAQVVLFSDISGLFLEHFKWVSNINITYRQFPTRVVYLDSMSL